MVDPEFLKTLKEKTANGLINTSEYLRRAVMREFKNEDKGTLCKT